MTGGSGHIGRQVLKKLRPSYELRAFDSVSALEEIDDVEYLVGDIRDFGAVQEACRGIDEIVHLAAIPVDVPGEAEKLMAVNFVGTFNIYEAAAHTSVSRVVFASSICRAGVYVLEAAVDARLLSSGRAPPSTPGRYVWT